MEVEETGELRTSWYDACLQLSLRFYRELHAVCVTADNLLTVKYFMSTKYQKFEKKKRQDIPLVLLFYKY